MVRWWLAFVATDILSVVSAHATTVRDDASYVSPSECRGKTKVSSCEAVALTDSLLKELEVQRAQLYKAVESEDKTLHSIHEKRNPIIDHKRELLETEGQRAHTNGHIAKEQAKLEFNKMKLISKKRQFHQNHKERAANILKPLDKLQNECLKFYEVYSWTNRKGAHSRNRECSLHVDGHKCTGADQPADQPFGLFKEYNFPSHWTTGGPLDPKVHFPIKLPAKLQRGDCTEKGSPALASVVKFVKRFSLPGNTNTSKTL